MTGHWVYFLRGQKTGNVKVGITGNLDMRLAAYRTHNESPIELLGKILARDEDDARRIEKLFIDRFSLQRSHGEWFTGTSNVLRGIKIGLQVWQYDSERDAPFSHSDLAALRDLKQSIVLDDTDARYLVIGGWKVASFSHPKKAVEVRKYFIDALSAALIEQGDIAADQSEFDCLGVA